MQNLITSSSIKWFVKRNTRCVLSKCSCVTRRAGSSAAPGGFSRTISLGILRIEAEHCCTRKSFLLFVVSGWQPTSTKISAEFHILDLSVGARWVSTWTGKAWTARCWRRGTKWAVTSSPNLRMGESSPLNSRARQGEFPPDAPLPSRHQCGISLARKLSRLSW